MLVTLRKMEVITSIFADDTVILSISMDKSCFGKIDYVNNSAAQLFNQSIGVLKEQSLQ